MIELYLTFNALLICAYLVHSLTLAWRLSFQARLWLARISLGSCLIAPMVLELAPPPAVAWSGLGEVLGERVLDGRETLSAARPLTYGSDAAPGHTVEIFWLLAAAGIVGVLISALRLGRDVVKIRRILRTAVPYRLRGRARVLISKDVKVPFSCRGPRRAFIVLPVALLESGADARIALSHEAQHHRQGDCLVAFGQEVVRALCWWNPLVHRWLRRLADLQEFSCDEALVGRRRLSPHDYGSCLVRVARAATTTGLACAIGMASSPPLERRIRMLFQYQAAGSRRPGLVLLALALSLVPTMALAYVAAGVEDVQTIDRSKVDGRLQSIAEEEVRATVARLGAKSGAVVIVEPRTGDVLAFAEAGVTGWEARAIGPGSVVKPLLVSAALDAGLVTPDTLLDCRNPLVVDGNVFHDHASFGTLSVKEGLAKSSNSCAIRINQELGLARAKAALASYGLTEAPVSLDEGESSRLARFAIGQTVSASLVALARAYGKLATEGGSAINGMLAYAVTNGTGKRAALPGYAVAGKTGTMAVKSPRGERESSFFDQSQDILGSFVGYVPADEPRLVIYAVVESAKGPQAGGGTVAAPLFRRVASRSLESMGR